MKSEIREKDVIVVGSGPGGATVAKELSIENKKVLILEWGDYEPLKGSFTQGFKTILFPVEACFLHLKTWHWFEASPLAAAQSTIMQRHSRFLLTC